MRIFASSILLFSISVLGCGASPSHEKPSEDIVPKGIVTKSQVRAVVHERVGAVRVCLETYGRLGQQGKVSVAFVISPDGSVANASIKRSTLKNQRVHDCIVKAVSTWSFPIESQGGGIAKIVYPFKLSLPLTAEAEEELRRLNEQCAEDPWRAEVDMHERPETRPEGYKVSSEVIAFVEDAKARMKQMRLWVTWNHEKGIYEVDPD